MKFVIQKLFISVLILVIYSKLVNGQEFAIINDTLEWEYNKPTRAYYWFELPEGTSSNWLEPYNYYNGQFYTAYQVISQPTNEPLGFQFGIWQWQPDADTQSYWSEIMEDTRPVPGGAGSATVNHSSPSNWWSSYEGVEFDKVRDFLHLGINIWCLDPESPVADSPWGGRDDVWAVQEKWFPLKAYIIIVAVANGHTFSGWDNYIGVTKPYYSVDYSAETTVQIVPSTDEWSVNSNMSGATSGTGQKLNIIPGQNLYFRTKAHGIYPASGIRILEVNNRPAKPDIGFSYETEITTSDIPPTVEYSFSSDMSNLISGTGTAIHITPGVDMFSRVKATGSSFRSEVQTLDIPIRPAAPDFSIDYENELTNEAVNTGILYSANSDLSSASQGTEDPINLVPGVNLYFRKSHSTNAFKSNIFNLEVPERPVLYTLADDTINKLPVYVYYSFPEESSDFEQNDLNIENANVIYFQDSVVTLNPVDTGLIMVKIKSNSIEGGNFASDDLKIFYYGIITDNSDTEIHKIEIYPNPFINQIFIEIDDCYSPCLLLIMDITGNIIYNKNLGYEGIYEIFPNNISTGIYLVKVITGSKTYINKIIKF